MSLGDKAAYSPCHLPPANACPAPVGPADPSTLTPAPEEFPCPKAYVQSSNVFLCSLQDLLALLQEHGPSTEGIWLAVSERASRQLREALDSGAHVQLESQPVHVLAIILKMNPADRHLPALSLLMGTCHSRSPKPGASAQPKRWGCCLCSQQQWEPHPQPLPLQDFLRKIPSKLLQVEFYQDWMSALQKTSRQERLAGLKE
ncbi:hypothetical protein Q9233_014716 [Columba guinea]|nr:hypothetical protein Q9233_014716 [Columba guinea]